jgi:hypothetical protein
MYGLCMGPKAGKRMPSNLGAHGANVSAFINNLGPKQQATWGQCATKKCSKLAPRFFWH